jgi:hypothetical protein
MVVGGELKGSGADGKREIHLGIKKFPPKIQFETLKESGTLGDLDIDEMLKTL